MPSAAPDEVKQAVLADVRAGKPFREIAETHGVAISTISRWATAAGLDVAGAEQVTNAANATKIAWAQRRGQLVDRFGEVAETMLDRVEAATEGTDSRQFMTAAAIAVDKAQLLSGGVTSRHEQLDAARRQERVKTMRDELAERRTQKDGTTGS